MGKEKAEIKSIKKNTPDIFYLREVEKCKVFPNPTNFKLTIKKFNMCIEMSKNILLSRNINLKSSNIRKS